MSVFRQAAFAAGFIISISAPIQAQSTRASTTQSAELVVVTAARLPQPLDAALSSVTVIQRADIERTQARTVEELLAGVEGIAIAGSGGLGKVTSVFVRGAESDHTLWLVDGVRIGSVTNGTPALQDLPLDTIERIEIVRGPRSSLYGADAIGGVVQIFTRRGLDATPSLRLTAGSHGTYQGSAAVRLGSQDAWVDLQATHLQTDGINSCLGLPFPPGGGCFTVEPDRDAYRNTSANLRAGYRFNDALQAEAFLQRAEGDVEFDGSFTNESKLVNQVAGIQLSGEFSQRWRSSLNLGRSLDESTSFLNGKRGGVFDSRRDSATWQNDFSFGERGTLVAGADFLQDRVQSTTRFVEDSRWNRAVFAQYDFSMGRQSVALSARIDDNEQYGSNATGSLAWGLHFEGGLQGYASIGNAFKAPSFNELYFPFFGNPLLAPERAVSGELGIKQTTSWGRWTLSAFTSEVDDLIAFDSATFLPQNIARARLQGIDGSFAWRSAGWRFEQSLTLLDAEDRSPGVPAGRELPRRPRASGRSTFGWTQGAWDLATSTQFAGRRYDDLANSRRLGGYVVVDVMAGWRMSSTVQLQLRLANAFDRQYQTAYLYPALGRELFVTVRYRAPQ